MNQLTLAFEATECNGWPSLRFCIDHDIQQEITFSGPSAVVTLDIDLLDGVHELEIERYAKTNNNVVFVDNKILQDQLVTLTDIYVDDVKLPDMFKYSGTFYYHDQAVKSGTIWGPNGKYIWSFETPLLNWLISQRKKGSDTVVDLFNPDNTQQLLNDLAKFKSIINDQQN